MKLKNLRLQKDLILPFVLLLLLVISLSFLIEQAQKKQLHGWDGTKVKSVIIVTGSLINSDINFALSWLEDSRVRKSVSS